MAKTYEQILAEEESKFKQEGSRRTLPPPGAELDLSDITAPIPIPRLKETKLRIADRGQLVDELRDISLIRVDPLSRRIDNPVFKNIARTQEIPAELFLKGGRSILTALQSAESGLASSLLAGLEGKPENMVDEFIQGVTGQKVTRLADLVRTTGLGGEGFIGEATAEISGFLAGLGLTNLATANTIGKGANAVQQSLKRAAVKGTRKRAFFFRDQAKAFIKGFDDAFSNMRSEFDNLYAKIGNKIIGGDDAIALQDAVVSLPKDVAAKISKIKGANFLDKSQRVLEPTVNSAKIIKGQISRTIPRNVWNGVDDGGTNAELYRTMKDSYFKLNEVIANNSGSLKPQLLKLNARFSSLSRHSEKLSPILQNKAGLIKTQIKNIKNPSMQDAYSELVRFSNRFFKDGRGVLVDIDRMNKSIKIQKGLQTIVAKGGPIAIGGGVAGAVIGSSVRKPILELIGGDSTPSGSGG